MDEHATSFPAYKNYTDAFYLEIPVSGERAPYVKEQLRVLFVFKIARPYVQYEDTQNSPTINAPYDVETRSYFLAADLLKMIVYNFETGEIYSRYEGMQGQPE
jgi:hypothetical protein